MLNMDFSQRVVIDSHWQDWIASPMPGVWRKALAREDAEHGHATSIVRYSSMRVVKEHFLCCGMINLLATKEDERWKS